MTVFYVFVVHQRNWPETLGEREYIGNLPVAALREVVSSSTSAVSSRRSSIDKSPSVAGVPHRHQLHLNLSPIAGSREVTFKDAASPALQTPDGDSWRGHYREEKFTKVPVIPPIGDKSSSPKASQGQGLFPHNFYAYNIFVHTLLHDRFCSYC